MKKIISLLLVLVLCISNINIVKAETKSDKDFAIELIDGLIGELKAIGYNNCYDENFDEINSEAYKWKIKHDEILKNIYVNGYSVYNDFEDNGSEITSKVIYSTYGINVPRYLKTIDCYYIADNGDVKKTTTTIEIKNYYYTYLSELEIIKQNINQDKVWKLSELIEGAKLIDKYDNFTNMMWLRQYFRTTFALKNTLRQSDTFRLWENPIARYLCDFGKGDKPTSKEERFAVFDVRINDIIKEIGNPTPKVLPAEVEVKNRTTLPTVAKKTETKASTNKTVASKKISLQITNLKLTKRVKGIKVSFDKCSDATKYQIQVSLKKNFKNKKTYNTTKTTKIIKKIKSKKKYFVRVRAIKGSNKSAWVVKKIKTK